MELKTFALAREQQMVDADQVLANVLPQIIWICSAEGRLLWVNERWYEFTGLTEEQTLNDKGALDAVHPDDLIELTRRWTRALSTASPTEIEYRIRDRAGEYRRHLARVAPVRDADGDVTRWVASVFDIHDWHLSEAARSSEGGPDPFFYRNSMPMAITRRSDGVFLFVNDAFTALTGYSREEVVGRTSVEVGMIGADERSMAATHFADGDGRTFEMSTRMKNGRMLTVLLANSHIKIDGTDCFLNTGMDLTYRRTMEDTLRFANKQKDEFLALLSHELRNPLTPILTSARLLQSRADTESRRDLEVIVQQVKHVSRLVDDLLDIARVNRGTITLAKTRLEPAAALDRAVAATAPLFDQRDHSLEIDVPSHGLAVEADEVRLTQIFDNLLSNAALYTPPGGAVRVTGCREGGMVTIRFRDTGRGIERSLLPELFESFVQGPRGPDRAEGGLGIGLSLVRALTELHGGTVAVDSEGEGQGSEFTVRLPAAANDVSVSSGSAAARNDPRSESNGTRLLIVDDHREVAGGLERLLRMLGYDVRSALNPHDAIDLAETFRPQIAVLDLGLPSMDGYTLATELRARLRDEAPILIALSGYNQPQDIERGRAAGFAAHLVKPIDVDDLVSALAASRLPAK